MICFMVYFGGTDTLPVYRPHPRYPRQPCSEARVCMIARPYHANRQAAHGKYVWDPLHFTSFTSASSPPPPPPLPLLSTLHQEHHNLPPLLSLFSIVSLSFRFNMTKLPLPKNFPTLKKKKRKRKKKKHNFLALRHWKEASCLFPRLWSSPNLTHTSTHAHTASSSSHYIKINPLTSLLFIPLITPLVLTAIPPPLPHLLHHPFILRKPSLLTQISLFWVTCGQREVKCLRGLRVGRRKTVSREEREM